MIASRSISRADIANLYASTIRCFCLGTTSIWFGFLSYKYVETNQIGVTVFLFALAALFCYRCFIFAAKIDAKIQKRKGQK